MSRKSSRDIAFKLIYQYMFNKEIDFNQAIDSFELDRESEDYKFVETLFQGVVDNYDALVETVSQNLVSYKLDRVYKLDLAVLVLAVFEIKYLNENPSIAINEAVELAKKYSTEKSPSFVNGVLAKIVK